LAPQEAYDSVWWDMRFADALVNLSVESVMGYYKGSRKKPDRRLLSAKYLTM